MLPLMSVHRLGSRFAWLLLVLLACMALQARAAQERPSVVRIAVEDGDWGDATSEEILRILQATAFEMQSHFAAPRDEIVRVRPASRVPMVLYPPAGADERVVLLTARGRNWENYVYEFGHELCHIQARYEWRAGTALEAHQWFEEALCETASLFVLRQMAVRWQTAPPWPALRSRAPLLADYAQLLLDEPHRQGNTSLSHWVNGHANQLTGHPYHRALNEYVANRLLALFEARPEGWGTLQYLNVPADMPLPAGEGLSFQAYLRQWYLAAPTAQRPFLAQLLALFELTPEAAPALTAARD